MATHPVGATNWDHCPHLHRWHWWTENKNCSSMQLRGVGGLVIGSSHCAGGCQRGWAGHARRGKIFSPKREEYSGEYKLVTLDSRYEELANFVKQNGHCNIPTNHPELGSFVTRIRREYKRYQSDPEASSLTSERIEQLNELGFVFDVLKHEWDTKM
eukprot:scaffold69274_cov65-Cyclotella_meneghiniana.AAC.1